MAAKKREKDQSAAGGAFFALAFLLWLIVALLWWILAAALLTAAGFVVRAVLRMHEQRKQVYAEYTAAMSARADEQLKWVDAGDERGIFGTPRPPLVEPPVPWSTPRLAGTIGGIMAAAIVGAVLLVNQRSLVADDKPDKPTASAKPTPSSYVPVFPSAATTTPSPAPVVYPEDFTGQDRQFAEQALARGLVKPNSIAGLPGFAHGTCTSLKSSLPTYVGIDGPALGWLDAKRDQLSSPYQSVSDPLLELAVEIYCPAVRPAGADQLSSLAPADTIFIKGWFALADKYRVHYPATGVMMQRAHATCEALVTAPEWEVVQDVDATMAGNNPNFKQKFVALAKESYCPIR